MTDVANKWRYIDFSLWKSICAWLVVILFLPTLAVASSHEDQLVSNEEGDIRQAFLLGLSSRQRKSGAFQLRQDRAGHSIVLTSFGGKSSAGLSLTCVMCTPNEILSQARSLGALLWAAESGQEPGWIVVSESVEGETLHIDGVPLAPAQAKQPVTPGIHRIDRVGRRPSTKADISISSGQTIDLAMIKTTVSVSNTKARPAILLSGIGITAAVLGGILVWLDGECADYQCRPHNTQGVGWGLIAGGAALNVGTLVWLLWPEKKITALSANR